MVIFVEIELFGTVDYANSQNHPRNHFVATTQMLTPVKPEFYQPHFGELHYFAISLIKDLSPSPSGQDGLKDLQTISRAFKNAIRLD